MIRVHERVELRADDDDDGGAQRGWGVEALVMAGGEDSDAHVYLSIGSLGIDTTISSIRPDRAERFANLLLAAVKAARGEAL